VSARTIAAWLVMVTSFVVCVGFITPLFQGDPIITSSGPRSAPLSYYLLQIGLGASALIVGSLLCYLLMRNKAK
jgi:hypothetical protein